MKKNVFFHNVKLVVTAFFMFGYSYYTQSLQCVDHETKKEALIHDNEGCVTHDTQSVSDDFLKDIQFEELMADKFVKVLQEISDIQDTTDQPLKTLIPKWHIVLNTQRALHNSDGKLCQELTRTVEGLIIQIYRPIIPSLPGVFMSDSQVLSLAQAIYDNKTKFPPSDSHQRWTPIKDSENPHVYYNENQKNNFNGELFSALLCFFQTKRMDRNEMEDKTKIFMQKFIKDS